MMAQVYRRLISNRLHLLIGKSKSLSLKDALSATRGRSLVQGNDLATWRHEVNPAEDTLKGKPS